MHKFMASFAPLSHSPLTFASALISLMFMGRTLTATWIRLAVSSFHFLRCILSLESPDDPAAFRP